MQKRVVLFIIIAACSLCAQAQIDTLHDYVDSCDTTLYRHAKLLKPKVLGKWDIPAGNYSGITPLGDNHYAVVTDKPKGNGFYEFYLELNDKGKLVSAKNLGFHCDSINTGYRDMEGIVYVPYSNTIFISAENDQQILEYALDGQLTGRKLNVPEKFAVKNIQSNNGFEALAYSTVTHLFWTTTENILKSDLATQNNTQIEGSSLRIQSFTSDFQPALQYAYMTDAPLKSRASSRFYCFGVPEITALPDGSLLIMERELYMPKKYLGAFVTNKIYRVCPDSSAPLTASDSFATLPSERYLQKTLVTEFRTSLRNFSNYEGMCLGPQLPDGTQTLLLICDSQDRDGNALYHLKDRIRVILLK